MPEKRTHHGDKIEFIAEAIWLAEGKRALGKRLVSWEDGVSEEDKERYRFLAEEVDRTMFSHGYR